jgi:phage shock protein A
VIELHSEVNNLQGRMKGEERAKREEQRRRDERVQDMRDELDRVRMESEDSRAAVIQLEEELIKEEERAGQLQERMARLAMTAIHLN